MSNFALKQKLYYERNIFKNEKSLMKHNISTFHFMKTFEISFGRNFEICVIIYNIFHKLYVHLKEKKDELFLPEHFIINSTFPYLSLP